MSATAFQRLRREQAKKRAGKVKQETGELSINELRALAKEKGLEGSGKMKKVDLLKALESGE